jgi:hypothetical protein
LITKKFGFPTPRHPFYHIILKLDQMIDEDHAIKGVQVDGKPTRDLWVYNDKTPSPTNQWLADKIGELIIRVDWENNSTYSVEIEIDKDGQTTTLSCESQAPQWGGYWNNQWKYYSAHILTETGSMERRKEPVHLQLSYYAERLSSPENEIRVVSVDTITGLSEEVPSQVYGVSSSTDQNDENAQPSTSLQVAFLADVPAKSSKVYLVFYGNPDAEKPSYPTDLAISGEGLGVSIENSFYRVDLHDKSGQIHGIFLKQGVDVLFEHNVEAPGPLHWNPDVYAPPRIWSHACDWDPPENYTTISGPIFITTKRWGPLPDYPDVQVSVTYTFYAHQPHVMVSTVTDIHEDLHVRALRNGEIVVNLNYVREYAWKHPDGRIMTLAFEGRPQEPRRAVDIPAASPWWAFFNREIGCSLAAIILESTSMRRAEGLTNMEPYITMKWGPWAYCVRPLVYSFNSTNPQRLLHVPASSSYSERLAFFPTRLGSSSNDLFEPVESLHQRLSKPLNISEPQMEVDERVPPAWGTTFPYPWI